MEDIKREIELGNHIFKHNKYGIAVIPKEDIKEKTADEIYICVEEKTSSALYYLKSLGRRRIYRQSYPLEPYIFKGEDINKGLKLFTYKKKENAQKLCDDINSRTGQNFKPVLLGDE